MWKCLFWDVSPCLVAACYSLVSASKPETTSAKVPGGIWGKCLCADLLCMGTWEAIAISKEFPLNKLTSAKLICLQVDVTCCSQLQPAN